MTLRLISSFLALPFFFIVIYFLPPIYYPIAVSAICLLTVYELLWRSKIVQIRSVVLLAYLFAAAIPFWVYFGMPGKFFLAGIFLLVLAFFVIWIYKSKSMNLGTCTTAMFSAVIIPLFFSSTISIFNMQNGKFLILIPFISAWLTDSGAYFTGTFFGKNKLAPTISPKKTIEGAIGGILVCIISFIIYGVILQLFFGRQPAYLTFMGYGLVLSVIAQIGDLSFSLIKREYNIKDYGVIFPGHGGILDRFDSVIFTAPAALILLRFFGSIL